MGLSPAPAHAGPGGPAVVTDWNTIAARTIFTENATPVPVSGLYFGFVSVAVYDAVVAIKGGFEPYARQPRAPRGASPEAAAVTAAYRVLTHYFPASAANLSADYAASLAQLPPGSGLERGKRVGETAAATIIALRENDGRNANVSLDVTPAPGVWRPTPTAFAPMLAPWLGFVRPMVLRSPKQMRLPGPDGLDTKAYARDLAEVTTFGALNGSSRTPEQTETALFWNANSVLQYQEALRDQVVRRGLGVLQGARAFALLGTATADALIACWRAKYDYAFWRPITAIRTTDPGWTPLVQNPPYPDYTSGHACVSGAASNTFGELFGHRSLDLRVFSSVTSTTRTFQTARELDQETMNARIWLGIHFRRAMTDGNRLGHRVSDWTIDHWFEPTR
ncbi:vanadium-dependent haloperoxidase [Lentzea waywayandensis]|uniref:vanadium-dependent haloperoxidase n=1 Tax=Lentzea waywayandensis TaxID=84724 RepID=UPI001160DB44|nr:vanadium-dependent haloperoxidase [Lentzea waywayandensis]